MKRIQATFQLPPKLVREWEIENQHAKVVSGVVVSQPAITGIIVKMTRKRSKIKLVDGRKVWVKNKHCLQREYIDEGTQRLI